MSVRIAGKLNAEMFLSSLKAAQKKIISPFATSAVENLLNKPYPGRETTMTNADVPAYPVSGSQRGWKAMTNADVPAYPVSHLEQNGSRGLSKRETAILMAMQGLCARPGSEEICAAHTAEIAIAIADATLAAMENPND